MDVTFQTVERSQVVGEQLEFEEWGSSISELTPDVIRRAQLTSTNGVFVTGRQAGGVAANSGLRQNDIILTFDGAPVENLSAFKEMYDDLLKSDRRFALLTVKRGALSNYVLMKRVSDVGANGGSQ